MPANIVKPGQERYWERAKKRAAEEGHAEDWAYITGIFKKMTLNKSFVIFPRMAEGVTPGQVPDPRRHEGYQLMTAKPKPVTAKMMLLDTTPRHSIRSVVQNLGLSQEDEEDWEAFLESAISGMGTAPTLAADILTRAREKAMDPHQRLALHQRVQQYLKDAGERARPIEVLQPLRKAQEPPSSYYAKIPDHNGGYRYFATEEDYLAHKGKTKNGDNGDHHHEVHAHVAQYAENGAGPGELKAMAEKHGPRQVAQALKEHHEAGTLKHQGGRVYAHHASTEDKSDGKARP